jgi:hypothetical protein
MNFYQLNYLSKNILDKGFKILNNPKLIELYFNEYFKGKIFNLKIDSYIISYPKCGRTWLYKILSLYSLKINSNNYVKDRKLLKFNNTFIKFVHDCSDPSPYPIKPTKFKNKDLINKKKLMLLRDPREVIVSHWHHLSFREKTYNRSISEFIDDEYLGVEKIISFYNFLNSKSLDKSKIITYEKLVKDTFEEVKNILTFLNLEIDENLVKECIEDCSFEKLQKNEIKETKNTDIKTMKFRKGLSGNFNNDLSEEDLVKINNKIRQKLSSRFKEKLNLTNI